MQKPKPYRSPMRRGAPTMLPPRRLRRAAVELPDLDPEEEDIEIVFEWEETPATHH